MSLKLNLMANSRRNTKMAIQVSGTTVINDSRKVLNLQGMRVPTYSSDPSSPSGGDVYLKHSRQ